MTPSDPPVEALGTVVRVEGVTCLVVLDGRPGTAPAPDPRRCALKRGLRVRGDAAAGEVRVAAGDRVVIGGETAVLAILPRRSKLARRAAGEKRVRERVIAANLDQVVIVVAAREPAWRPGFVDRLLAAAESQGVEPLIIVNKSDLLADGAARAELERDLEELRALGYRAFLTSIVSGEGVEALRETLRGRLSAVCGPSGVGKSSLLNVLEPGLRLAVGEVSGSTHKGRHTTTSAVLLPLRAGGYVVDTPGVREFGFADIDARDLPWLFRELARLRGGCHYNDCAHATEPGCAVKTAAESGAISRRRYESYLRIRASLLELASRGKPKRDERPESRTQITQISQITERAGLR